MFTMTDEQILKRAAKLLAGRVIHSVRLGDANEICLHAAIRLRGEVREKLLAYWFAQGDRLLFVEEISAGGDAIVNYSTRDLLRKALRVEADSVVMVHNHPTGDSTPSEADREAANRLNQQFSLIGVMPLGHYVVTSTGAENILTGDRCTFISESIRDETHLCARCNEIIYGDVK
jgi:DNA repair protein RadC